MYNEIAGAIKEALTLSNVFADGDQQKKRLFVKRYKQMRRACNAAEEVFFLFDTLIAQKLNPLDRNVITFVNKYKRLRTKFDKLD